MRLFVNARLDRVIPKSCKGSACTSRSLSAQAGKKRRRQLRLFDRALGGMEVQDLLLMDYADIQASSYAGALKAFYDLDAKRLSSTCRARHHAAGLVQDARPVPSVQLRGNAYLAISNELGVSTRRGLLNDAYSIQAWIRLEPFDGQDAYTVFANGDLSEEAGMSLYVARRNELASWRAARQMRPMVSKGTVQPEL